MQMDNNVIFPAISFDKPGVYPYTIKELTPSGGGWLTDKREFRAVVTVTRGESGKLEAQVDYPDGSPCFYNIFCCDCCRCCCCRCDCCDCCCDCPCCRECC